jgi:hypothetical protein
MRAEGCYDVWGQGVTERRPCDWIRYPPRLGYCYIMISTDRVTSAETPSLHQFTPAQHMAIWATPQCLYGSVMM